MNSSPESKRFSPDDKSTHNPEFDLTLLRLNPKDRRSALRYLLSRVRSLPKMPLRQLVNKAKLFHLEGKPGRPVWDVVEAIRQASFKEPELFESWQEFLSLIPEPMPKVFPRTLKGNRAILPQLEEALIKAPTQEAYDQGLSWLERKFYQNPRIMSDQIPIADATEGSD